MDHSDSTNIDTNFKKLVTDNTDIDPERTKPSRWATSPFLHCLTFHSRNETEEQAGKGTMEMEGKDLDKNVKQKHGGWKTMPFIFGNEIGEKLAAIGFSANLITYLTQELHMDTVKAANTLTNFGGTSSLTPLLGAFLADAYVGRFWMITVASVIYLVGMSVLTLTATKPSFRPPPCSTTATTCIPASNAQLAVVFTGFFLTSMGAGGIRPCVSAFGADQFDSKSPKQEKNLWSFFNWYYFCMGLSALTAVTVIVYVQDNVGWDWGFGIPALLMLFSIVSFIVGLPMYVHVPPMGSPLTRLARVVVAAYKKRKLIPGSDPSCLYELTEKERAHDTNQRLMHTDQFKFLDKAAVRLEEDTQPESGRVNPWRLCTITEVEELKAILRMGPIWASGILLITASAQQHTFSVLQARTMNRHIGHSSFQIPPGSMSVFSILGLLITVPLYDRIFMPFARRITGHPRGITFLQRMGVGFLIAIVATLVAGFVEVKRKHVAEIHGLLDMPKTTIPISVFWLFPQYCLHGIAEAFMSIGHLEFFYDQSPESMRSTAMALFWTSISAGSYLSSFLVSIIHASTGGKHHNDWLPNNLNRGHLDYLFWLLTILQLLNFIFFYMCARWYRYKLVQKDDAQPRDEDLEGKESAIPNV